MISVCIPNYNGSKYIGEQLKSILSQLSENMLSPLSRHFFPKITN